MKIHLLMHFDGGNRGCEAITKSTAILLNKTTSNIWAYSQNKRLDAFLGINQYCSLLQLKKNIVKRFIWRVYVILYSKIFRHFEKNRDAQKLRYYRYCYLSFMKKITSEDIYLSTGGDMMCYDDNNEIVFTNNYLHKKGVKTILWGCSMEHKNLTPIKLDTLKNFSAIYARESLSYSFFNELGLKNVIQLPDPAFILKPQICKLPIALKNNEVVGINLSKFVLNDDSVESDKAEQILELMNYILEKTKYHIILIPHVFWNGQNDTIVCEKFKSVFENNPRISLLKSEKMNYCEIRYVISKCKFFIGARTHSVISAYSMLVPTIALGYSIKSRGIAKDIGLPDNLVVDFRENLEKSVLLNAFLYMQNNETQIRSLLQANMPPYIKKLEDFDFRTWIGKR